jgi:hypothetical protein
MQPHHARNMAMGVASGIPEVAPLVPQNDYISNTKPATPLWVESYRLSLLWLEMKISQNKWEYPEIIQKQIIDNFSIETHGELGIPHFENPPNPTCLDHNIVNQLLYIIHIITIIIIQNNPTMFFLLHRRVFHGSCRPPCSEQTSSQQRSPAWTALRGKSEGSSRFLAQIDREQHDHGKKVC